MERIINLYELYDGDKFIAKGDKMEIAEIAGCSYKTICGYALYHERPLYGRYWIKKAGTKVIDCEVKKPEKPREDNRLEYLATHLKIYGNTVLRSDPKKYLEELESRGLKVKARKVKESKKEVYYVLEVV